MWIAVQRRKAPASVERTDPGLRHREHKDLEKMQTLVYSEGVEPTTSDESGRRSATELRVQMDQAQRRVCPLDPIPSKRETSFPPSELAYQAAGH